MSYQLPESFKLSGNIKFLFDEMKVRGKFTAVVKGDSLFFCDIYSNFGHQIASVTIENDDVQILMGDEEFITTKDAPLSTIPFFRDYPLRFSDLARIITGRSILQNTMSKPWKDKSKVRLKYQYTWHKDQIVIQSLVNRRHSCVRKLRYYTQNNSERWVLEYNRYDDGFFKNIYFKSTDNNYFSLKIKKIKQ